MKPELIPFLRCPRTGAPLSLEVGEREDTGDVHTGWLVTDGDGSGSGHRYPIVEGVPDLTVGLDRKVERTAAQFAHEFTQVAAHQAPDRKRREDVTLFMAKTGLDPAVYGVPGLDFRLLQDHSVLGYDPDWSAAAGRITVDGGCGDGRFAELIAPHVPMLICLDVGDHIYATRERLRYHIHVHFVRCNLLHVPLADGVVDWVYSIGVIHHTPEPPQTVRELARVIRPRGTLSAWVYPPEYWGHPIKGAVAKRIRRWLLRQPLERQLRFIRRYLMPLGRLQLKAARSPVTKVALAPLFLVNVPRHDDPGEMEATTIDYYLPEYIETYTDSELMAMMEGAGLQAEPMPFPTSARGVRPGPAPAPAPPSAEP